MLQIAGIAGDSIVDGPGLRVTVFAQGCPHHCEGCHNPETWDFGGGTPMSTEDVMRAVRADSLCKGVTFSGGEPFAQAEGFAELAAALRAEGYEVAAYSGYTFEELLAGTDSQRKLLGLLDILIDGRFESANRSLSVPFRGSTNQRIIDVPASLKTGGAVVSRSPRWNQEW